MVGYSVSSGTTSALDNYNLHQLSLMLIVTPEDDDDNVPDSDNNKLTTRDGHK